jgi:hypothetical protein
MIKVQYSAGASIFHFLRFQVFTLVSIIMTVFLVVVPCNPTEINLCFRDTYCLRHQRTSRMLVNFYETIWCNIPDNSLLHSSLWPHKQNLKLPLTVYSMSAVLADLWRQRSHSIKLTTLVHLMPRLRTYTTLTPFLHIPSGCGAYVEKQL